MDGRQRWHVGKEIPLALIAGVLLQTVLLVSWATNLSAKLDKALDTLQDFKAERYTREDARRDFDLLKLKDAEHERQIEFLNRRLVTLEDTCFRRGK